MSHECLRSWLKIDTGALTYNIGTLKKIIGRVSLMGVVKSNAYGHGMVQCAKILAKSGCAWLGVDDVDEALELRRVGIKKPILVFGYTLPARLAEAAHKHISVTVASLDSLKAASRVPGLKIHIKLETGLNRQGITPKELNNISTFIEMLKCCEIEGAYSHFAAAELAKMPKYKKYCELQMNRFEKMYDAIVSRLVPIKLAPIRHMAGTAATMLMPRSRYDLVRVGIGLYGLDPTSDSTLPLAKNFGLKPALSWYSVVVQVKEVKKGERVGYNLTEKLTRSSKLAIVPVGYWHGYPRALSSNSKGRPWSGGEVLVHGKRCKVVGRISMDMMTVDVTDVPGVKVGDKVTLIGQDLSAEEVATKAGTINYELVTRINPLLPRIYK